jgi:hypothetical protein
MKSGASSVIWAVVGTVVVAALILLVLRFHSGETTADLVAARSARLELVGQMRRSLASAAEAEKSAVMAITDRDSQVYAGEARAATAQVENGRVELGQLLERGGAQKEKDLLSQFSKAFSEFQRVDKELLDLAVKNTNIKASALAFGPAAQALTAMRGSLSRVIAQNPASNGGAKRVTLAAGAQIAAMQIGLLIPPHIAEESDKKMDEIEAVMANEDNEVRKDLKELAAIFPGNKDVEAAGTSYSRFSDLRKEILKLSRENTNVRSLSISLNEKRKVMSVCQDALAALEKAIDQEPIPGLSSPPARPR